jgi:hypothetical protein
LAKTCESGSASGSGVTVLVADDETPLRQAVVEILRATGYTVFEAQTALDAVNIAKQNENLDILLTDVVMPGLRVLNSPAASPSAILEFTWFICRDMPKVFPKCNSPRIPLSCRNHFGLQLSWNSLNSSGAKLDLAQNLFQRK